MPVTRQSPCAARTPMPLRRPILSATACALPGSVSTTMLAISMDTSGAGELQDAGVGGDRTLGKRVPGWRRPTYGPRWEGRKHITPGGERGQAGVSLRTSMLTRPDVSG